MLGIRNVVVAAMIASSLGLVSGRNLRWVTSRHSRIHRRRLSDNAEGGNCPTQRDDEYKYNVDINFENMSEGCDEDDYINIGLMIQDIVDEVEAKIPYYRNEFMKTDICAVPIETEIEDDPVRRLLGESKAATGGKLRRRRRYIYRGRGHCRVCRLDEAGRRTLSRSLSATEAACDLADAATFGARISQAAVDKIDDAITHMNEDALQCEDLFKAHTMVKRAKDLRQEGARELELAKSEANTAKEWCDEAKRVESDEDLQQCVDRARTASTGAMGAARRAQSHYFDTRNHLETNVCMGEVSDSSTEPVKADKTEQSPVIDDGQSEPSSGDQREENGAETKEKEPTEPVETERPIETEQQKETEQPIETNDQRLDGLEQELQTMLDNIDSRLNEINAQLAASPDSQTKTRLENEKDFLMDERKQVVDAIGVTAQEKQLASQDDPRAEIKEYLQRFVDEFLSAVQGRLLKEYNAKTPGPGCLLQGFTVNVKTTILQNEQSLELSDCVIKV